MNCRILIIALLVACCFGCFVSADFLKSLTEREKFEARVIGAQLENTEGNLEFEPKHTLTLLKRSLELNYWLSEPLITGGKANLRYLIKFGEPDGEFCAEAGDKFLFDYMKGVYKKFTRSILPYLNYYNKDNKRFCYINWRPALLNCAKRIKEESRLLFEMIYLLLNNEKRRSPIERTDQYGDRMLKFLEDQFGSLVLNERRLNRGIRMEKGKFEAFSQAKLIPVCQPLINNSDFKSAAEKFISWWSADFEGDTIVDYWINSYKICRDIARDDSQLIEGAYQAHLIKYGIQKEEEEEILLMPVKVGRPLDPKGGDLVKSS